MGCAILITAAWQCVPHGRAWRRMAVRPSAAREMLDLFLGDREGFGDKDLLAANEVTRQGT